MNKQQALERLTAIEAETVELRRIIEAPEKDNKQLAREYLVNWLNENREKLPVKLGQDRMVFFKGDQWVIDLDFKNKLFWCYYYEFWQTIQNQFGLDYSDIQDVVRDTLLKPFNCDGFTPPVTGLVPRNRLLKPFNCDGFTPYKWTSGRRG